MIRTPAPRDYTDFDDNLDDIERYIQQHGIPASQFSDEIKAFVGIGCHEIQKAIDLETPDPRIAKLSQQMGTQHHDLISYRSETRVADMDIGDIFASGRFVSTSLHKGVAAEHGYKRRKPYPIGTFLKVRVPRSAKSLLLDTFEYELLLDKETQLKVLDRLDIRERGKVRLNPYNHNIDIATEKVYRAERMYLVEVIL